MQIDYFLPQASGHDRHRLAAGPWDPMKALNLPDFAWHGRDDNYPTSVLALEAVTVTQRPPQNKNVKLPSTTLSPVPDHMFIILLSYYTNVFQVVSPRMASYQTSRESPNLVILSPPVPFLYPQRKLSSADEGLQNATKRMIFTGLIGI